MHITYCSDGTTIGHRIDSFEVRNGRLYYLRPESVQWEQVLLRHVQWGFIYLGGREVINLKVA